MSRMHVCCHRPAGSPVWWLAGPLSATSCHASGTLQASPDPSVISLTEHQWPAPPTPPSPRDLTPDPDPPRRGWAFISYIQLSDFMMTKGVSHKGGGRLIGEGGGTAVRHRPSRLSSTS